ncbi:MAG: TIGR00282 family metallophosphoesterase [Kiloniellales bacterium]
MRFLFLGDIVGRSGREVLARELPALRRDLKLDFVVANVENAAAGFGVTKKIAQEILASGVDVMTGGNHSWDQREALSFIEGEPRLLRPANYPAGTPGRGVAAFQTSTGKKVLIVNVLGRLFMDALDDPFQTVAKALESYRLGATVDAIIVDMHAEATSEKMAMGHFCDGRASLVVGTHTHVPTADTMVMEGGTAYQTDAGMCGDYNSVIGMDKAVPVARFTKKLPTERMSVATGPGTLCGVLVESDPRSGLAKTVEPIRIGGVIRQADPRARPQAAALATAT